MKTIKGGYHNKLLRINLSDHSYKVEEIPEEFLLKYIGGRGLGVKILFDELPAKVNPLSPENTLSIALRLLYRIPHFLVCLGT